MTTAENARAITRTIRVGYYAAAADAAGCDTEEFDTSAATITELAQVVARRHGERMSTIISVSSFLVGDELVRDPETPIGDQTAIDILPPFAGG